MTLLDEKPRPCPFCKAKMDYGEASKTVRHPLTHSDEFLHSCPLSGMIFESVQEWNTRPIEDALRAEIEGLYEVNKIENKNFNNRIHLLKQQLADAKAKVDVNSTEAKSRAKAMVSLIAELDEAKAKNGRLQSTHKMYTCKECKTDFRGAVYCCECHNALFLKLAEAKQVIENLVDEDECRLDHHGYCQTHRLEEDCSNQQGKNWLAELEAKS